MGRLNAENSHSGTLYPVDTQGIYRIIYEVVNTLPTENIKTSVIYCVPIIGKVSEYDMFLYINSKWAALGSGSIDLSDYYTKEEVDDKIADISTLSFKIVQEKPTEDIKTNVIYLIPKSVSTTGNIYEEWIYISGEWELLGTTDIDLTGYMSLAPLNPTAEQIAALPVGQLYGDTMNHKGVVKSGQEFYDTFFVNDRLIRKITNEMGYTRPPAYIPMDSDANDVLKTGNDLFRAGDYGGVWFLQMGTSYVTVEGELTHYWGWKRLTSLRHDYNQDPPPELEPFEVFYDYYLDGIRIEKVWLSPKYQVGDYYYYNGEWYICNFAECEFRASGGVYVYQWTRVVDTYTKTKIDAMIGDIESLLSEV